jgi:hypothetical protein
MEILQDRKAVIAISDNGWTNNPFSIEWIKFFDRQTIERIKSIYRLLIVNGHGSHLTRDFIKYALNNRIIVYCLPSHATHNLQPLDVAIFGPAATYYRQAIANRGRFESEMIDKIDFLHFIQISRV